MKPNQTAKRRPATYDDSDTVDLLGLFGVLKRRKWLVLLICAIGTAAAALYGLQLVPQYTAKTAIIIEPDESQVIDVEAVMSGLTPDQATISTQIRLIESRTYQARVMEDLGLFDDPNFNPRLQNDDEGRFKLPIEMVFEPLEKILSWMPDEWLIATGLAKESAPVLASEAPRLAREYALQRFARELDVSNDGSSYIINVAFTSPSPEMAALISNRTAEIYVDDQLKNKLFATDRASVWLEERIVELQEEVRLADEAVAAYNRENDLIVSDGVSLNQQELSQLNSELILARAELAERQAKLRLVRDLSRSGQGLDSLEDVSNSPLILRLRDQQTELARQEAELSTLYGARHPRMTHLANEKQKLDDEVERAIQRILRTQENDLSIVQTRIRTIESQLAQLKTVNAVDREAEVKLRELERQATTSRELYENFLTRFKETREQQEIVQPDVRIVSVASPPTDPSSPGPILFTAVGFTLSFVFSTFVSLLLDRLDRGLRSAKEVQEALGLPTLGRVPKLDKLKRGQKPYEYLLEKPLSAYAESIRSIYMATKLTNVDAEPKVILVTSSLPQEGKTTFAVSLAAFVARSDKKVLVIDLDLRHPSVHRELDWQVSSGLVEYMGGELSLEEVIHQDLETGLHFLPVKNQTTNPTDLLESKKIQAMIDMLRHEYDYIVLDSAPVASVTDTRVAARLADKVLFVLKWGETVASAAEDSVQALRDVGCAPAGVVLSQIDLKKHAQYGYGDVGEYYSKSQKYYVN